MHHYQDDVFEKNPIYDDFLTFDAWAGAPLQVRPKSDISPAVLR